MPLAFISMVKDVPTASVAGFGKLRVIGADSVYIPGFTVISSSFPTALIGGFDIIILFF
jgi:hypothetical protein